MSNKENNKTKNKCRSLKCLDEKFKYPDNYMTDKYYTDHPGKFDCPICGKKGGH